MNDGQFHLCIVGAGPRGLSVLERLCAQERREPAFTAVTVHVVDPVEAGPGAVWRTSQSRLLLTNTVAAQITVYTDHSVRIDGPIEPGPGLYDWAKQLALLGPLSGADDETLAEAQRLGPDDYPSRALYGRYLADSFASVVAAAPEHVAVRVHRSRAVAIADTSGVPGGPQGVRLADGTRLHHLDAVVLAQGHVPSLPPPAQARAASLARVHRLTYVTQANPADVDLDALEPGAPVLIRGLGLNFFDYLALLTAGRGGRFEREGERLRYLPSGREPRLFASSRRGVPSHARGENEKGASGRHLPRVLTPEAIARLRERHGTLRFGRDLWPLVAAEVESVYYATLLRPDDRAAFTARYVADPERLLDEHGVAAADRWDWERLARPAGRRKYAGRAEFRGWVLEHLARDVEQARLGNVSGPLKAALDVLRDLRNEIRLVVDHGGLDGGSYRDELSAWYTPFNAFLSIGPPASRIEELAAVIESGVVELTGPGTQILVDTEDPAFVAVSAAVPDEPVRARALVEARLHDVDLRRTADPLLRHMLDTEQCRPYRIPCAGGGFYETGGLAVTMRPYHVVDGQEQAHPRRFAYGVPTESVHWVTAAGIRPGVDSVTLGDADAIAAAVRALAPAAVPRSAPSFTGVVV
ncbi:FAD/NAD(P)-binding protein [Dactylosporangium sp. NPDC000555]|uniref:FAD/NAD(P)-binding protein n=1 Tax=Dactylosporangium sp. NPDC000555 TaxID=3154260 RepID=UPI00331A7C00